MRDYQRQVVIEAVAVAQAAGSGATRQYGVAVLRPSRARTGVQTVT